MSQPSLITRVSPDTSADVDYSWVKILSLVGVGVIFSFFTGYFWAQFLTLGSLRALLLSLVAAGVLLIIFVFQTLFIKSSKRIFGAVALEAVVLAAPIYSFFSLSFLVAMVFLLLLAVAAHYAGQEEIQQGLKIRYFRISRSVLVRAFTGFALFWSIIYGSVFFESPAHSKQAFDYLFTSAGSSIERYAGNIARFTSGVVVQEVVPKLGNLGELPQGVELVEVQSTPEELQQNVEGFLGTLINTERGEEIYNDLLTQYEELDSTQQLLVRVIFMAVLFFAIKGFSFFVRIGLSVVSYLVYQLLLSAKFAIVRLESRSREILVLK